MGTAIFLDTNAVMKLIELGGPEVQVELTRAVVANVVQRAFAKDLPTELKRVVTLQSAAVRDELNKLMKDERALKRAFDERMDEVRRSMGSFLPDPVMREARETVTRLLGAEVERIVLEQVGAATMREFAAKKTDEVVERLGKRIAGMVEQDAAVRVNALVKERVGAVIDNLGKAA